MISPLLFQNHVGEQFIFVSNNEGCTEFRTKTVFGAANLYIATPTVKCTLPLGK